MNAEAIYEHLQMCGATFALIEDSRAFEIDAPKEVLTPEMLELVRACKDELRELIYEHEEREAIEQYEARGTMPIVRPPIRKLTVEDARNFVFLVWRCRQCGCALKHGSADVWLCQYCPQDPLHFRIETNLLIVAPELFGCVKSERVA